MQEFDLPSARSARAFNPLTLVWAASLWMAAFANWPLWRALQAMPEVSGPRGAVFMLAFGLIVAALTALVLSVAAWRWSVKPVVALSLVAAAAGAHFMGTYSTVIDPTMMVNVLQTNARESRDLLSLRLLVTALLLAALPLAWLMRAPVQRLNPWRQLRRNLLGALGALALVVALLALFFADMSSTMRNHKSVRYLVNPLNSFYALAAVSARAQAAPSGPPEAAGLDARLVVRDASRPPLLLLVLGETARADHFSLNGYGRPTTPQLAARGVLSFHNVSSCGTSTAASLPCMFSLEGKSAFESASRPRENVLDVLQHAGLAVLWVDNQSGCKGVCDRVPHAQAGDRGTHRYCDQDGECLDEALLDGLDERIAALPAAQRERGVVVVLHQMGSHGPAYWRRSPATLKPFQNECQTNVLQQCEQQALVNSYDNSIAYTDLVLARAIDWLKGQATRHQVALLYVSDHGESLGENQLYLHGMPYALAPRAQTHVPMLMWLDNPAQQGLDAGCLPQQADAALTHDNLPHTLLGMAGVQTAVYRPGLDAMAPCRRAPLYAGRHVQNSSP